MGDAADWLTESMSDPESDDEYAMWDDGIPRDSCDECGGDMEPDEGIDGLCDQCLWWRRMA